MVVDGLEDSVVEMCQIYMDLISRGRFFIPNAKYNIIKVINGCCHVLKLIFWFPHEGPGFLGFFDRYTHNREAQSFEGW